MYYNIETSHDILVELTLPDSFDIRQYDKSIGVDISLGDGTFSWDLAEDSSISGEIKGNVLVVTDVVCRGDDSGWSLHNVIEPLFKDNGGKLHMVNVWEDGCIYELKIEDGEDTEREVDLVETVKTGVLAYR